LDRSNLAQLPGVPVHRRPRVTNSFTLRGEPRHWGVGGLGGLQVRSLSHHARFPCAAAGGSRPAHGQLIVDLIEKITLWDLRVTGSEASERPDGKWQVRIEVRAKKLYAAGNGEETEAPLDQPIDIGLFAADLAALRARFSASGFPLSRE